MFDSAGRRPHCLVSRGSLGFVFAAACSKRVFQRIERKRERERERERSGTGIQAAARRVRHAAQVLYKRTNIPQVARKFIREGVGKRVNSIHRRKLADGRRM